MTASAALHSAARRILGSCTLSAVLGPAVVRVTTGQGEQYVVKQHATRSKHEREVYAYRHWTGSLGSSAPALVAVSSPEMIIITSALEGQVHARTLSPSAHRQAGALLRRFHHTEPLRTLPWFRHWLSDRAAYWTSQAAETLSAADHAVIANHLAALADMDIAQGRPCHLDFQPRNWIISSDGNASLVDFEHARFDLPARDFTRLRFRIWAARPDLRDAFLDGYGRPLTEAENQLSWHLGALDALTALARGHQRGDSELTEAGRATLRQLREPL
ncbi:MAG TPA: aminoglycoside phosphotransferase family protein [Streptosporangiaceae bacterium]|nr:aminoglycoside phosphotransferase family protein [Streptosporangiaceae bacterium]